MSSWPKKDLENLSAQNSEIFVLNPDSLLNLRDGGWVLSNPRTKSHVALDPSAVSALSQSPQGTLAQWGVLLTSATGIDRTRQFYGENGLHVDHTGYIETPAESVSGEKLVELLKARWLLIDPKSAAYSEFISPLTSVLDRNHLGTLHQRVGQFLTVVKRIGADRWKWWHNQKYTEDGLALKEHSPYKEIQERFIETYFSDHSVQGLHILDFGCGNGYYSAKLARLGAKVTGIDTSKELIELAQSNYGDVAKFIWIDPEQDPALLPQALGQKFDIVFMQDVLLLLLNPENGIPIPNLNVLLKSLRAVIKPTGKLHTMEPNAVFWLAGRYGNPQNPYAVITEYKERTFNVVPLMAEVLKAMRSAAFGLVEYEHPTSSGSESYSVYSDKFCIWDFMTFVPLDLSKS